MMFSKVKAAGVAAGTVTIIATILITVLKSFGIEMPMEVAVALVGAIITIFTVLAGWLRIERVGSYK